jgi:glycosyltransferase involved in cell wall biosynthesis
MGGARSALAVIGAAPANWAVHPYGAMESADFLRRLDFFVHYPHEDYVEEFGRAVLEALAIGLPAVLPPVFRETFGEAALYAEPAEAWDRIAALWADEAAYLAQARRGREFVTANSDWSQFPDRLARTVARTAAPDGRRQTALA